MNWHLNFYSARSERRTAALLSFVLFLGVVQSGLAGEKAAGSCSKVYGQIEEALSLDYSGAIKLKYHEEISKPLKEIPEKWLQAEMQRTVRLYSELYPDFPAQKFSNWLRDGNLRKGSEYRKLQEDGINFGEFLNREYLRYLGPGFLKQLGKQRADLAKGINEVLGHMRAGLKNQDGGDPAFISRVLNSIPLENAFKNSCVGKSPVALKSMRNDLAISLTAYGIQQSRKDDPSWRNFPWEYLSASVMFGVILGEVACRNLLSGSHFVGTEISEKTNLKGAGKFKHYLAKTGKNTLAYFKWIPMLEGLSISMIYAGENLRGTDQDPEDYLFRMGYFTIYDTVYLTLRRVTLLDPLYLKAFPWMERVVDNLVKSGKVAAMIRTATELGTRVSIRWGDTEIIMKGDRMTKDLINRFKEERAAREKAESTSVPAAVESAAVQKEVPVKVQHGEAKTATTASAKPVVKEEKPLAATQNQEQPIQEPSPLMIQPHMLQAD